MFEGVNKKYTTVVDIESLQDLIAHIRKHEILAVDTEDTSLNTRTGQVIGFSICGEAGVSFYFPILKWNTELNKLEELTISNLDHSRTFSSRDFAIRTLQLLHGKKLIFHNGAYDIPIIKQSLGVDLLSDMYCDTIMLIHTVQEEGVGRGGAETFGLKKVAIAIQDKIGLDVEKAANEEQIELKESILKNGGSTTHANYEIFKSDFDILAKYAAADTDLTYRIFCYFSEKLREENLEKFFYVDEVMPVYKEVTIPMQMTGVCLDIPLLEETKTRILADMEKYRKDVVDGLLHEEPGQRWVMDQALKTFPCKKTGPWGAAFIERYSISLPKTSKGYSIARGRVEALNLNPEDEWQRKFLLTGDEKLVPEKERIRISLQLWKDLNEGEYFNVQSASQLADIVFNYYHVEPIKTNEETGKDSFDGLVIQKLSKKYAWVESLRVYRKLQKIYTTYIERFLLEQEDGKYYPYWKQNGTVSGRYASNLQQLPKPMEDEQDIPLVVGYNRLVRQFIIAGKGRKFIDADYESLEPHCFAFVSGDKHLQEIFNKNYDFYSTVAIKTEGLENDKKDYPNGVSADKKSPVFLKKIDPVRRGKAKGYALGVPYGMSAFALGMRLGVSRKEAQKLIDGYFSGFPQLKEWYDGTRQKLYKQGYIVNYLGRIRHLSQGKRIYDMFGEGLLDWKFRADVVAELVGAGLDKAVADKKVMSLYMEFKNARNNALNYQLQSLGAGIVNRAALAITRKAKELGIDATVIAQIHDQIVVNCEESRAEEFRPWVEKLMETTTVLPGVPLRAPAEVGDNMAETH